jgi:hypothetical protein
MMMATRTLRLIGDDGDIEVPVSIHMPVEDDRAWRCDYEIGWPRTPRAYRAFGYDGMQALVLALSAIAIDLYTSRYHHAGLLIWDDNDAGYGFPLGRGMWDHAVVMDKRD